MKRGALHQTVSTAMAWARKRRLLHAVLDPPSQIAGFYDDAGRPRLFDPVNGLGMYIREPPAEIDEAYRRLFQILKSNKTFCERKGIRSAVLLFPQRFQVQPADWRATVEHYGLRADQFDLMLPNRRIRAFCRTHSIFCVDSTESMRRYHRETEQNLYFPLGDMHWNRHGHRVFWESAKPDLVVLIEDMFRTISIGENRRSHYQG